MTAERLSRTLARLDELNSADPVSVSVDGNRRPRELAFADRLEAWVRRLKPDPSEELLIAARGQHVQRWKIPRSSYPDGRAGYLTWREELKQMHSRLVAEAMRAEDYEEASIERARNIVLKRLPALNAEAQTIEDALCLVFLESQLEDLRRKTPEDKMVTIIRKTWRKMSDPAREIALTLPLPKDHLELIQRSLA